MRFIDKTQPEPAPPPPVPRGPALPEGPRPPWRVEMRTWGGVYGQPTYERPTKIRHDGSTIELLVPESDEAALWHYAEFLEGEVKRLTVSLETAVLLAPGPALPADTVPVVLDPARVLPSVNEFTPTPTPSVTPVPANGAITAEIPTISPDVAVNTSDMPDSPAAKRARAERELMADPTASNPTLAERAGCSDEFVRRVRHALVAEGRLPLVANAAKKDSANDPVGAAANTTDLLPE